MNNFKFQQLGNRLTKSLITGDFDLYRSVMDLPMRVIPRGAEVIDLTDEASLKTDFELYHISVSARQVTDIYRRVLSIENTPGDPDVAVVTCEMNILHHAERLVRPFTSLFSMRQVDNDWRIFQIESLAGHIAWTLGQYEITPQSDFAPTIGAMTALKQAMAHPIGE